MSSDIAIRLSGISKCYQAYPKPVDRLIQSLYRNRRKLYKEFWALSNVSLDVMRGETLGIIGSNGSGKSTLLQIIANILMPTSGRIDAQGRVSALLELGAGFNPEFTGRENARFNAAILGFGQRKITDKLDSIRDFANLGEFFDRPIKTYSSGMYVRLGFAVAIHMEPDILIVDEALAVGDVSFQRKCFRQLNELKQQGTSILFVTHAMSTVVNLCDRAVWLEKGEVKYIGEPKVAVNLYLEKQLGGNNTSSESIAVEPGDSVDVTAVRRSHKSESLGNGLQLEDFCQKRALYNSTEFRWGSGAAQIIDFICVDDQHREIKGAFPTGGTIHIYAQVYFHKDLDELVFGLTIKHLSGVTIFGSNSILLKKPAQIARANEVRVIHFSFENYLLPNDYFISLGVARGVGDKDVEPLDRRYDLIQLRVTDEIKTLGFIDLGASFSENVIAENVSKDDGTPPAALDLEMLKGDG